MPLTDRLKQYLVDAITDASLAQLLFDELENIVLAPVDSATVIEAGDMVWLDTDDVKPASDFTWDTENGLGGTQALFAASFLGIAMDGSAAGETSDIRVDVSATHRHTFALVSSAYNMGDPFGPDEDPSETLSNTRLEKVGSSALGIARIMEFLPSGSTSGKVCFASAFTADSANANASIG